MKIERVVYGSYISAHDRFLMTDTLIDLADKTAV
jgi:hypothetical protein